jgi:translocation and assembly module TamB
VHINAMGLDSDLQGSLLVRKQPEREPAAEGKIRLVNGSFTAYGRELAIREGELTFTGPLNDPIVDVQAVRSIETIDGPVVAGIRLTGRAQDLTATVFSEPAMADADALSYLVVGRPLNQATEAESQDLSGAAVALGLRQANRLVDQIGQSIGLDELSMAGDGGESTALIAGKKLNRRLYARYSYGVFSRLGSFLLRYRMTDKFTLEAATGENHSIDVVYSIETP